MHRGLGLVTEDAVLTIRIHSSVLTTLASRGSSAMSRLMVSATRSSLLVSMAIVMGTDSLPASGRMLQCIVNALSHSERGQSSAASAVYLFCRKIIYSPNPRNPGTTQISRKKKHAEKWTSYSALSAYNAEALYQQVCELLHGTC